MTDEMEPVGDSFGDEEQSFLDDSEYEEQSNIDDEAVADGEVVQLTAAELRELRSRSKSYDELRRKFTQSSQRLSQLEKMFGSKVFQAEQKSSLPELKKWTLEEQEPYWTQAEEGRTPVDLMRAVVEEQLEYRETLDRAVDSAKSYGMQEAMNYMAEDERVATLLKNKDISEKFYDMLDNDDRVREMIDQRFNRKTINSINPAEEMHVVFNALLKHIVAEMREEDILSARERTTNDITMRNRQRMRSQTLKPGGGKQNNRNAKPDKIDSILKSWGA